MRKELNIETVKKIRRLAQVLIELGKEYEEQLKPDTIASIKRRVEELALLARSPD
jgi:hypothetical protein